MRASTSTVLALSLAASVFLSGCNSPTAADPAVGKVAGRWSFVTTVGGAGFFELTQQGDAVAGTILSVSGGPIPGRTSTISGTVSGTTLTFDEVEVITATGVYVATVTCTQVVHGVLQVDQSAMNGQFKVNSFSCNGKPAGSVPAVGSGGQITLSKSDTNTKK